MPPDDPPSTRTSGPTRGGVDAHREPRLRSWQVAVSCIILLCSLFLLSTGREDHRSHTADEANHLVRGVAVLQTGTTALSYSHPPLANVLVALPLGDRIDRVDLTDLEPWSALDPGSIGVAYFKRDFDEARRDLSIMRHTMACVAVAFALVFFLWVRKRWGSATALIALALFAGHPTLVAHAGLATTDIPLAFATFVTLTQFTQWLEDSSPWRLLAFAFSVGVLLATKHTAVVMFGIMVAIASYWAWNGRGRFATGTRRQRLASTRNQLLLTGAIALLGVNASYGFQETALSVDEIVDHPEPRNWISRNFDHDIIHPPSLLPGATPVPLPYTYVYGLVSLQHQSKIGHLSYLAGIKARRNPLYFPVLILIKTPVGILGLLGLAAWLVRKRRLQPSPEALAIAAFCTLFVLIASFGRINIGVRHVLPVFPFMAAFAARTAVVGWTLIPTRLGRAALVGATVSAALAAAATYPYFISHFNALAGGRSGGHRISVVGEDWGQDNTELADWLLRHDIDRIAYYDAGRPLRHEEIRRHGLKTKRLRCHDVPTAKSTAVTHITDQVRYPGCLRWTQACDNIGRINHHLYVWDCPASEELEAIRTAEAEVKASRARDEEAAEKAD